MFLLSSDVEVETKDFLHIGGVFWLYMECLFNILGNTSSAIVTYSFIKPPWQIYLDGPW